MVKQKCLLVTSQTLTATINPQAATDQSISWSSSDPAVATVDTNGAVTALVVGSVDITATANDESAIAESFSITINPILVESITLTSESEMNEGTTQTITAGINPSDATDNTLFWSSSNTALATVDQNGVVSAIGVGEVDIIATANDGSGISGSISIEIMKVLDADKPIIEMEIWPNPTGEMVNIVLPKSIKSAELTILNQEGKIIERKSLSGQHTFDLSTYKKGIYFFRFQNCNGLLGTERIILK